MVYNLRCKRANSNRGSMKRECCICRKEFRYDKVKLRGPHKVRICNYCLDVLYFEITDSINKYGL